MPKDFFLSSNSVLICSLVSLAIFRNSNVRSQIVPKNLSKPDQLSIFVGLSILTHNIVIKVHIEKYICL
jgi:hypothetical protein